MMQKLFFIVGTISGLLATVFGAFAAHALKGKISPTLLSAYNTGVQYQFYHAIALLLVGILLYQVQNTWLNGVMLRSGV